MGLSLAAVAGSDFSRAFLNQVELGRSRPSTRTLQIIAQRLQRPVDYFLNEPGASRTALELTLTEAATRLRRGDPDRAIALLTHVLAGSRTLGEMRVRAQLLLAEAYLRRREASAAIPLLQTAITAGLAGRWRTLTVDCYDRMGTAHYIERRANEAGRWFDKALTAYEDWGLKEPLLKARIHGHRANIHFVAGAPREAIVGYQNAIAAAEDVLDMQSLGGIYEGLAVSLQQAGDFDRALDYAQRSLRLFDTLQDVRMSAQLRNNMAEILLQQGQPAEAEALYLRGAGQLAQVGDNILRPHLLAGAAEAALNLDHSEEAAARIKLAILAAETTPDPLALVAVHRIAGRIAQARGEARLAREHFEKALQHAAEIDSPMVLSRVAYDYARALQAQGEAADALLRYRQAYEAQQTARA